ncbi:MAG TPA: glycosyl hydrolase family 18 protein [Cyclobacteriaceae bacterium]|nr:glycosyl hydrolase family 18 protein [Cyclobacteriaceae bacterium]
MNNIKSIFYIPIVLIALLFSGCDDTAENPTFSSDEIPRIFNWVNTYTTNIVDSLVLDPPVSPSQGATYKWTIDGVEVSAKKHFNHTFDEAKNYTIKFEVTRNGVVNSRTAQVIVIKPFVPKTYNKKMVGFLTRTGILDDINFDNLTHLVISSALVGEVDGQESLVDTTFTGMNIPLIVKAAHNAGVYVMLDVTGNMAPINGGGLYADYGFYNVIKVTDKRDKAITTIMKFASDNDLDGVNIFLNNTSEGPDALNADIVKGFFNAIPASLPKGPSNKFFYSASVPGGWTTGALSSIATIEAIDWVNIQPYRYEDLAPTSHSPFWAFTDLAATWISYGLPKEKVVGGFPAFGLHYHMPTDGTTVTWGNLWLYTTYETYKSILARDASANTKSKLDVDDGIYYDGFDVLDQKAQYVKDQGYGGLMMWSIESDTKDQTKSLLKEAYTKLGN